MTAQKVNSTLIITALLLTISGCDPSHPSPAGPAGPPSAGYEFNTCNQGTRVFSTREELCAAVRNPGINRCSLAEQDKVYEQNNCANLVKPVGPGLAKCWQPQYMDVIGTPINSLDVVDGERGVYTLLKVALFQQTDFKVQKSTVSVMGHFFVPPTDPEDERGLQAQVACKDMSQAPEGSASGKIEIPLSVDRETGAIAKNLVAEVAVVGEKQIWKKDSATAQLRSPRFSYWSALTTNFADEKQPLTLFKRVEANGQIVLVLVMDFSANDARSGAEARLRAVATYRYSAKPKQPVPAPEILPVPKPPDRFADSVPAIIDVCKQYSYNNDTVACLLKFKTVTIPPEIVPICRKYSYTSDTVNCLLKFKNTQFLMTPVLEICKSHSYINDQVACVIRLKDYRLSDAELEICKNYSYTQDQISCVEKLGTK